MTKKFTSEENAGYWEDPKTISIIDKNLHRLEMDFVTSHLRKEDKLLDLGSGNGRATHYYADHVSAATGLERSQRFYNEAQALLEETPKSNLKFINGDLTDLEDSTESYDVIVTQRMLINLPSWEDQQNAVQIIKSKLNPGGRYLAIENTYESNDKMNEARQKFEMKEIGLHWHNIYLNHDDFMNYMKQDFDLLEHRGFSLYYLLTRVFAQTFASFEGFGAQATKDPIFDTIDQAARVIQENYGSQFCPQDDVPVGPIQGFAFTKKEA